jgi:hypothetical protein
MALLAYWDVKESRNVLAPAVDLVNLKLGVSFQFSENIIAL